MKKKITALALALAFAFAMFCPAGLGGMTAYAADTWDMPLRSGTITSGFGYRNLNIAGASKFHEGIDISSYYGDEVLASRSGYLVVKYTGCSHYAMGSGDPCGEYHKEGNWVVIDHQDGTYSAYKHLKSVIRQNGWISKGEVIGYEGATGLSTGPHLHFEIRVGARDSAGNYYSLKAVNPVEYFSFDWDIKNPSTYPAYPNDWFAINHNGTKAYYVKFIQAGLRELGYSLDVDGSFGYGTRDVVIQYQRDNGIEVDGNFGPGSWNKLIQLLKNKFSNTPQNTSNDNTTSYDWDIKKPNTYPAYPNDWFSINHNGTNAYYVKFIQSGLRELGYSLDVDGSFGYGTRDVVIQYQRDNGIEVDGNFGPGSWNKLIQLLKNKFSTTTTTTTATTTNTLKIATQPINKSAKNGDSIKLSLKAEGKGLTYQWFYKKNGAKSWSKMKNGTKSSLSFKMTSGWDQAQFKCTVKNSSGKSVTSKTVKATMFKITTQPKNKSVKKGNTAKFTIKASGINVKYQWYYKKSSASSWTKWNGKTSSSVSLKATNTWNGAKFYCLVTDDSGSSIKSSSAKLTVKK